MLHITNGTVVTPDTVFRGDVLLEGEKIVALGTALPCSSEVETIDATGCLVLPGIIDCHLHFNLLQGAITTRDDFETGSRAAAAGGVTCFLDYITQQQGESFAGAFAARRAEADGHTLVDYGLHLNVNDIAHGQLAELPSLLDLGISSIKIYTTYKQTGFYVDDWVWYTLLRASKQHGILVEAHCENDDIMTGVRAQLIAEGKTGLRYHGQARPAMAETETVYRGLYLARAAQASSYFVHQSSADSVDAIVEARQRGQRAITETCPHYLLLTEDAYAGPHPERYTMTPPLRDAENCRRLWAHVAQGNIACIGTDHCGYTLDHRLRLADFTKIAPGIPSTELLLNLLYSEGVAQGRITLQQLVSLLSTNPARVFGLAPAKGSLSPGRDADLVIFDPEARWTVSAGQLVSAAGYSPYEGMTLSGRVLTTLSRGRVVYDRGNFPPASGHGRFVRRGPHDPEHSFV